MDFDPGPSGSAASGGAGGNGSFGRLWDTANTYNIFIGSESAGNGLSDATAVPPVHYITTPVVVTSKSFDTGNTKPTFNSITSDPATSEVSFQISGSEDNFISDDSGWVDASQMSTLTKKRYVKFRMTLTNSNYATPTKITSVSINYTPPAKKKFLNLKVAVAEEFQKFRRMDLLT